MNNNSEGQNQPGYIVNPFIISGAGIICSGIALVTYHFFIVRLCLQNRQQSQQNTQSITPPANDNTPSGVDPDTLKKIPILPYSYIKGDTFRLGQTDCAICLGELYEGDKVRLLPSCSHVFHTECIDPWFVHNSNCPNCRAPLVISPPPPPPPVVVVVSSETVVDAEVNNASRVQSDHNIVVSYGSTSRASPVPENSPQDFMMGMKRSVSLDNSSYVSVCIERDEEHRASSSSCSSSPPSVSAAAGTTGNSNALDQISSMFMVSFTQFRNSRNDRSKGVLPN